MIYACQNRQHFSYIQLDLDRCDFNIWLSDDISTMQTSCRGPRTVSKKRDNNHAPYIAHHLHVHTVWKWFPVLIYLRWLVICRCPSETVWALSIIAWAPGKPILTLLLGAWSWTQSQCLGCSLSYHSPINVEWMGFPHKKNWLLTSYRICIEVSFQNKKRASHNWVQTLRKADLSSSYYHLVLSQYFCLNLCCHLKHEGPSGDGVHPLHLCYTEFRLCFLSFSYWSIGDCVKLFLNNFALS